MPLPDSLEAVVRDRLAKFGLFDHAYVKAVTRRGRTRYVAYGADGTKLWQFRSRELADAAMTQQDLRALSVH
ncbi:hypothetical protein [Azospirillum canadense]|uniref:hypothetical protein n=1 Tax=Azospirillum canadense TaxID=403962 RepID=UPI002226FA09|nr:hypothetical protein [Azospirillum canadense]MCW2236430.1 hypothetical protein [Azospirillum canadense]